MLGNAHMHSRWAARLLLAGGLLLLSAAAEAQIRYVASTGNDSWPCTRAAAPCRTLQRGIIATPAGGEVRVLDSIYGGGTIDRSLTISAGGATIIGRIFINNTNAVVALRDVNLNGAGSRDIGIRIIAASAVHIERCTVERFIYNAIYSAAPNSELFVTDSMVRDNGGPGITVYNASAGPNNFGSMTLSVDNSHVENNGGDGFLLTGVAGAAISRTVVSGNQANGINLNFGTASITLTTASENGAIGFYLVDAKVTLDSSIARGNETGLAVLGDTSRVNVSNSTFTNNNAGILVQSDPGTVSTRENNTVVDNTTDVSGSLTPLPGT